MLKIFKVVSIMALGLSCFILSEVNAVQIKVDRCQAITKDCIAKGCQEEKNKMSNNPPSVPAKCITNGCKVWKEEICNAPYLADTYCTPLWPAYTSKEIMYDRCVYACELALQAGLCGGTCPPRREQQKPF